VKDKFNRAVANIRAGINEPSFFAHLPLVIATACAGTYAQSAHPVAGLVAAYMVFAALRNYHYDGRMLRSAETPKP
jgi:hypothetical protein